MSVLSSVMPVFSLTQCARVSILLSVTYVLSWGASLLLSITSVLSPVVYVLSYIVIDNVCVVIDNVCVVIGSFCLSPVVSILLSITSVLSLYRIYIVINNVCVVSSVCYCRWYLCCLYCYRWLMHSGLSNELVILINECTNPSIYIYILSFPPSGWKG